MLQPTHLSLQLRLQCLAASHLVTLLICLMAPASQQEDQLIYSEDLLTLAQLLHQAVSLPK
uniref:Alternative protein CLINT1 n=1 Tax=Homo sapiens TaxID=9606 RepID=L8EAP9_HUMAN|nr:alternative protein CLINT1 [Homo sapiens]